MNVTLTHGETPPSSAIIVTIPGQPRSKGRPRFRSDGRVYSETRQEEHAELLRTYMRQRFPAPLPGNVAVFAQFYRSTAHRIDIDNLLKLVLDAANGICWVDDIQVTEIGARLELDRALPRTIVEIGPTTSSLVRGGTEIQYCLGCGIAYSPKPGYVNGYHSTICAKRSRAFGTCAICKMPLQKRGALLCKRCWLTKAKKNTPKATLREGPVLVRGARTSSSTRRGVSYRSDTGKWAAYVQWDGRRLTLGSFVTEAEAIAAVDAFENSEKQAA